MFMVVSYWEPLPGKEAEFEKTGPKVAAILRKQPGVVMVEGFKSGKKLVSVHAYKDEATYRAVVDNPNGPFAKAAKQYALEEIGRWLSSERGATIPHE
jgi:heme-degrading monooxygenase HmoA